MQEGRADGTEPIGNQIALRQVLGTGGLLVDGDVALPTCGNRAEQEVRYVAGSGRGSLNTRHAGGSWCVSGIIEYEGGRAAVHS